MKRDKGMKIKAILMIALFWAVLSLSMLSLPYMSSGDVWAGDPFSSPEIKIDTPTSLELMKKKIDVFRTVSEENGKTVVTVFSEDTYDQLAEERKRGERFSISTHEMIYLIDSTYELFKSCDVVKLYDAEGVLHKYYGVDFYSSEEYFGLFGSLGADIEDATFRFRQDLYDAILLQAEVLCGSFVRIEETRFVGFEAVAVTDLESPLTGSERSLLAGGMNPWRKGFTDIYGNTVPNEKRHCGIWKFSSETISFHRDAAAMEYSLQDQQYDELMVIYPDRFDLSHMGLLKYDSYGNVVIVELVERESGKILGRLRFNDENDPEVIERLMELQAETFSNFPSTEPQDPGGDYYAVVYFNDFGYNGEVIHLYYVYCPDGNTDLFALNGYELKKDEKFCYRGGKELAEYFNRLLKEGFGE